MQKLKIARGYFVNTFRKCDLTCNKFVDRILSKWEKMETKQSNMFKIKNYHKVVFKYSSVVLALR